MVVAKEKIIDTDAGESRDYSSINNWEAGEQGYDFIASGEYPLATCRNSDAADDTTAVVVAGWSNIDETHNPRIMTASGSIFRNNGVASSGYRLKVGGDHCCEISEHFVLIDGIVVYQDGSGASDEGIRVTTGISGVKARNCVILGDRAAADQDGIYAGNWSVTDLTLENCIVYDWTRAGANAQNYGTGTVHTWHIRGCTFRNCGNASEIESGAICARINDLEGTSVTINVFDTIGVDTVSTYKDFSESNGTIAEPGDTFPGWPFNGTLVWNGSNNITSDDSANRSNLSAGLTNRTVTASGNPPAGNWVIFENITEGSEDYHLASGVENDALVNAVSLSGFFTDDIDGDIRTEPWDVGADQQTYTAPPPPPVPTITTTIGSASGRDYSTINLWEADLDASGVYSSGVNAVGQCYADSDFDEFINIDGGGTLELNGIQLTSALSDRHIGVENTGPRLTRTVNGLLILVNTPVDITMDFLEFTLLNKNAFAIVYVAGNTINFNLRNCLIYNSETLGATSAAGLLELQTTAGIVNILNNIVYGVKCVGTGADGARGISSDDATPTRNVINNTVYGSRDSSGNGAYNIAMLDSAGQTYKNNLCMDASGSVKADFSVTSPSSATATNNLSSDASASGHTNSSYNKMSSKQFISTVEGSENFKLKLKSNAINVGAVIGTVPAEVNIDIVGRDRDASSALWDVGAFEYPRPEIKKTVGTSGRDYSTWTAWLGDLEDPSIYDLGSHAIGEGYNDSVFSENVLLNHTGSGFLQGITLTAASGERHDGTADTGVTILNSLNPLVHILFSFDANEPHLTLEWIDINGGKTDGKAILGNLVQGLMESGVIRNCIIHDSSGNQNHSQLDIEHPFEGSGGFRYISNNILYNAYIGVGTSGSKELFGIKPLFLNGNYKIFNNTVFRMVNKTPSGTATNCIRNWNVSLQQYYNNIGVSVSGNDSLLTKCFQTNASTFGTSDFNLSSDDSVPGVNSLSDKLASQQFISTVLDSENLKLVKNADAIGAGSGLGTSPEGINFDIINFDRVAAGVTWDIGAHQFQADASRSSLLFFTMW